MQTLYHGTNNAEAILANENFNIGFHMTPDLNVARNYGNQVIALDFDGNFNKNVGNGIEVVIKDNAQLRSFWNAYGESRLIQ